MSLKDVFRGPKFHQLPKALSEYIQDQAASGISELIMLPFMFPVFVVNPSNYTGIGFWFDRNPKQENREYYVQGLAPTTLTKRWNYVVPEGRKAFLEILQATVYRITAPTTPGRAAAYVRHTPEGELSHPILRAEVINPAAWTVMTVALGQAIILLQGDILDAYTIDTSTGGTIDFRLYAKITEFDA